MRRVKMMVYICCRVWQEEQNLSCNRWIFEKKNKKKPIELEISANVTKIM